MPHGAKVSVVVVVSGAPQTIVIETHQHVAELIRVALHEAGIRNHGIDGWSLRFAEGGAPIPPSQKIDEAGIHQDATLFLDPEEGGGGEAASRQTEDIDQLPVLVDPEISAGKLDRELDRWDANREVYDKRGWFILERQGLSVDVAFAARLPVGPMQDLVAFPLAVRLGFQNYDLWAPSLRVIDPITRRWLEVPRVGALDFTSVRGEAMNLFINGHPQTGHVFFCRPGVREYHSHPEHSGDDWLLYRGQGFGNLAQICDSLWRLAVRSVTGLTFTAQRVTLGDVNSLNQAIELRQEDIDELSSQMQAQMQMMPSLPPELRAQLAPALRDQLDSGVTENDG